MKVLVVICMLVLSQNSFASEEMTQSFSNFFDNEITEIEESLAAGELSNSYSSENSRALRNLNLSNFSLRIRASAGFEVPIFAELKVIPQVELIWDIKERG
ncbi:MAG: hypothetical protein R3B45_11215 [Bdellovibrionota bacterium]